MKTLSLLTEKGFLASRAAHAEVQRTMASGELRATASVITSPGAHLYAADSHVTKTYAEPVTVRDESEVLALIRNEELTSENGTVKLAIEVSNGSSIQRLYLGRYSPEADAHGLSLLGEDMEHLERDAREALMRHIHEGHAIVTAHRVLFLQNAEDDIPTVIDCPYAVPSRVSSGAQLREMLKQREGDAPVGNVVTVLLEVRHEFNTDTAYFAELHKPSHMERWDPDSALPDYDEAGWRGDSLFHSMKFRGKEETESEIVPEEGVHPFRSRVLFDFTAREEGEGEPFLPLITLSVDETCPSVADIDRILREFDECLEHYAENGREVWDFYPGEGPFVPTEIYAATAIWGFADMVLDLLGGIDWSSAEVGFHIALFR